MTSIAPGLIFFVLLLCYTLGSIVSVLLLKNHKLAHLISSAFAIAGSVFGIILSTLVFVKNYQINISIPTTFDLLAFNIHIDSLSAFFILIISAIALLSSIYGIGYMRHYEHEYNLAVFGFFYNIFLVTQILVVSASNAIFFLYVWELMTLSSLFLVIYEYKKEESIRAGILYFMMTHIGTLFITAGFFVLYKITGSFNYSEILRNSSLISPVLKNIIFVLFFIGFGTKTGIIPLHIWLPRAHSSAPSHVSALMSGVMIKIGIFMMIRVFVGLFTNIPIIWGGIIIVSGGLCSVLGVLYALSEHDLKKLLAYHSIENIGIILMGLGSGLLFTSLGNTAIATLSFAASLYHILNHATFKSLLFMSAGSVISKTDTRDMEKYGGLIKTMPYTGLFFLVGSIAIAGFPPFNGFASEWLTFQSLFAGISENVTLIRAIFIFAASSLAFTGGLAAACFVKAFGIIFLARPRTQESQSTDESGKPMLFSMTTLAVMCLVLGIASSAVVRMLTAIVSKSTLKLPVDTTLFQIYSPLNLSFVLAAIVLVFAAVFAFVYIVSKNRKETVNITWNCGFDYTFPRAEITSTGFARSLILIFRGIFRPSKQARVEFIDANSSNPYLTKTKKVMLSTTNIYEKYLYRPVNKTLQILSEKVKIIQGGNINIYLSYILITLICVLVWVRYF